jgi:hypothetical protein
MRRLSRMVPALTFTMLVAASLAHAQSTGSLGHSVASSQSPPGPNNSSPVARGPKPVWAKVCGKGTMTSKERRRR